MIDSPPREKKRRKIFTHLISPNHSRSGWLYPDTPSHQVPSSTHIPPSAGDSSSCLPQVSLCTMQELFPGCYNPHSSGKGLKTYPYLLESFLLHTDTHTHAHTHKATRSRTRNVHDDHILFPPFTIRPSGGPTNPPPDTPATICSQPSILSRYT